MTADVTLFATAIAALKQCRDDNRYCSRLRRELRFGDYSQFLARIRDANQRILVDRVGRKICVATCVLGALTPMCWISLKWRWRIHGKPTCDATTRFLCVNSVFTRAALLVLLSFTKLCTVGKEFVPLGDEKHDPPSLGIGQTGGDGSGFCL